eukprot:CAMPEP_0114112554 /NCGR_PEP_ID=MMETSP0043_2-20121206/2446_1 /TAXON_ID=464988 /ORGANISM="Hemiselmis andersenii, Strain CCMP644" /LENGTH=118 /DNA_ID=CAMNT_0001204655 /DNA_START=234 /DNA_END=587 /DNA_ORIENTATION=+
MLPISLGGKSKASKLKANNASTDNTPKAAPGPDSASPSARRASGASSPPGSQRTDSSRFFGAGGGLVDSDDEEEDGPSILPSAALEGLIKQHGGDRPPTVGRPSVIGERTVEGDRLKA